MSYCQDENSVGQRRWIDSLDYERLLSSARQPIDGGDDVAVPADGQALLVRGVLSLDGAPATLKPGLAVHQAPTADEPDGTHGVVVLDDAGTIVAEIRFTPTAQDGDPADGGTDVPTPDAVMNVVLPADLPGASRLEVRALDGTVVATSDFSETSPTVAIDAPATGAPDTVHVTWQTDDADGDTVSSTLLYSADSGATWQMVAADLAGTSVDLARWSLPASQQALLRVVTSDGLRSTEATTPPFALPDLAPVVSIDSPVDGTVLTGAQAFEMTAQAYDAEDGALDGTSVRWTSDLDGQLATGATVLKRADELSEGTHVITVTARDSAGTETSTSIQVVVRRIVDTTPEEPQAACEVRYVIHGTWDVGSTVQVFVRNTGTTPWNGWSIAWALPPDETIANSWSADLSINGSTVTASSLSWNGVVQPGAEVTFGLNGAFPSGTVASVPTAFRTSEGLCS